MEGKQMKTGYTFVSVSTAEPGRLDELAKIASTPSEQMDGKIPGLLARQVSVDRERNAVVVWATFDRKETLYAYLETEDGKKDHGKQDDMSCISSFAMYDLVPVSERIPGLEEKTAP